MQKAAGRNCLIKDPKKFMETQDLGGLQPDIGDIEEEENQGWFRGWIRWCPTSMKHLREAERKILSYLKTSYKTKYVNIGPIVGPEDNKIWTLTMNEKDDKTPLVLLHGLGSGVALWALNLDSFASTRPTYAFDLLGFGRSSRPNFGRNAIDAETELIQSIEEWRKQMNLDKFVLLGHSLGGFLATSYAIRHPNRVSHLILADPWGFPEKPDDISQRYPLPFWVKIIGYMLQPLNPLWGIRAFGPVGPKLVEKARPDLIKKFSVLSDEDKGELNIAEYIFHANCQHPSGEAAFHAMMNSFGWARYPMCNRLPSLKKEIPLTVIYGSRSWVDHCSGTTISEIRGSSYVDVQIIQGAGHHLYADKKDTFNQIVLKACSLADEKNELELDLEPSNIVQNDEISLKFKEDEKQ